MTVHYLVKYLHRFDSQWPIIVSHSTSEKYLSLCESSEFLTGVKLAQLMALGKYWGINYEKTISRLCYNAVGSWSGD